MSPLVTRKSRTDETTDTNTVDPSGTEPGDKTSRGVKQRRAPAPAPTRTRRKPALTAAGIALIALGGVGGGWLASQGGTAKQVVVLRNDIKPGHKISMTDLTTTQMTGGAGTNLVPSDRIQELVGKYPTGSIPAGTMVTWPMTTTSTSPINGTALVGLAFKPGQMPGAGLQPGQKVTIVLAGNNSAAGGSSSELPAGLSIGQAWEATIADLPPGTPNAQTTTVDLYVASKDVNQIATASGVGTLALAVTAASGSR